MGARINIETEHCPQGAKPFLSDYWLAWADGVQGDGETMEAAIENAKVRLVAGEAADRR